MWVVGQSPRHSNFIWGSLFNSRHPDPRRVWKVGSGAHLLPPLPEDLGDPGMRSETSICDNPSVDFEKYFRKFPKFPGWKYRYIIGQNIKNEVCLRIIFGARSASGKVSIQEKQKNTDRTKPVSFGWRRPYFSVVSAVVPGFIGIKTTFWHSNNDIVLE